MSAYARLIAEETEPEVLVRDTRPRQRLKDLLGSHAREHRVIDENAWAVMAYDGEWSLWTRALEDRAWTVRVAVVDSPEHAIRLRRETRGAA